MKKPKKKTEIDLQKRFEAYQATIDFHMTQINTLFPECTVTLLVRNVKEKDVIVIYSNDKAVDVLKAAQKKLKDKDKVKGKAK